MQNPNSQDEDHKVKIAGGQDAGTLYDIQRIQELVTNVHASDVLAALQVGLKR